MSFLVSTDVLYATRSLGWTSLLLCDYLIHFPFFINLRHTFLHIYYQQMTLVHFSVNK